MPTTSKRYPPAFVHCPECKEEHTTDKVEFVGIEETIEGWDKMTYVCPTTGKQTAAIVRRKR